MSITFQVGDYWYENPSNTGAVRAWVDDNTKEYYAEIPTTVTYNNSTYTVNSLRDCFSGCSNLKVAPVIPSTITNMQNCFRQCTSLSGDVYIMTTSVSSYTSCFAGITNNITIHGTDTLTLERLRGTNPNYVYVNITPVTLPSTIECAPMNYMTDNGLVQLSPQTDTSLVSVQVPNGSGTITTTLEDALVDLSLRTTGINCAITTPTTMGGITVTPLGDGRLMINGTTSGYEIYLPLIHLDRLNFGQYKLVGCDGILAPPRNISNMTYRIVYSPSVVSKTLISTFYNEQTRTLGLNAETYSLGYIQNLNITCYFSSSDVQTFNNLIINPKLQLVGDA